MIREEKVYITGVILIAVALWVCCVIGNKILGSACLMAYILWVILAAIDCGCFNNRGADYLITLYEEKVNG